MHTYQLDKPDNLVALLEESVAKYPNNRLFGTKNKQGVYEWVTYREVGQRVDNLRGGLAKLGVKKGDAVTPRHHQTWGCPRHRREPGDHSQ
jgi:long-chain acyl-CoA synthetase